MDKISIGITDPPPFRSPARSHWRHELVQGKVQRFKGFAHRNCHKQPQEGGTGGDENDGRDGGAPSNMREVGEKGRQKDGNKGIDHPEQ